MTTTSIHHPSSSPCSTAWIPLEGLTEQWATLAAHATTTRATAAVGAAFCALSQERHALRHMAQAAQAEVTPLHDPHAGDWFDDAACERECALERIQEAAQFWHQAARDLAWHLRKITAAHADDERRLCSALLDEAQMQRVRMARLVVEVLDEHTACYRQHMARPDAPQQGRTQP